MDMSTRQQGKFDFSERETNLLHGENVREDDTGLCWRDGESGADSEKGDHERENGPEEVQPDAEPSLL